MLTNKKLSLKNTIKERLSNKNDLNKKVKNSIIILVQKRGDWDAII